MREYNLVGLGTYRLQGDQCVQIIKSGLELGYRQIDTAQLYQNQNEIAQGIKLSGISRSDIFIQSKISNSSIKKKKIAESIDQILKELDTGYLDLLLLHNPVKNYELAWDELIRCQTKFNIRYIGVSNFDQDNLDLIIGKSGVIPWLNQIQSNIFNQHVKLIDYNKKLGILTQSHTTLTKSSLTSDPNLVNWSNQIGMPVPDLMFKYILDQGIGILPRTSDSTHLESNYNLGISPILFDKQFVKDNEQIIKSFDIGYSIY